jgi:hypothetical protein
MQLPVAQVGLVILPASCHAAQSKGHPADEGSQHGQEQSAAPAYSTLLLEAAALICDVEEPVGNRHAAGCD